MATVKQQQLLDQIYVFICTYIREHGYAPSQQEIASGCYLGRTTLLRHLDKLEMMGRIQREDAKPRSIHIIDDGCPAT